MRPTHYRSNQFDNGQMNWHRQQVLRELENRGFELVDRKEHATLAVKAAAFDFYAAVTPERAAQLVKFAAAPAGAS